MHQQHRHHQHEYLWPGALRIDEIVTEGSRMVPCYEGPAEKAPTGNLSIRALIGNVGDVANAADDLIV